MADGTAPVAMMLLAVALLILPNRRMRLSGPQTHFDLLERWQFRGAVAFIGVAAAGMTLALPIGAVVAVSAVSAAAVAWSAREPRASKEAPGADRDRVADVLDLMAPCLDSGLPLATALEIALGTAPNPDGPIAVLREISALLALGADPQSAWRSAGRVESLTGVAAAARRAAQGGVRMADALREASAELRAQSDQDEARRAARAGVAMTAPLAVCFLPAFLCIGLAPVLIALVSSLPVW